MLNNTTNGEAEENGEVGKKLTGTLFTQIERYMPHKFNKVACEFVGTQELEFPKNASSSLTKTEVKLHVVWKKRTKRNA